MKHRILIKIFGNVQGVGFRLFIARKARELGIFGFVENNSDGSVEIVGEGEENNLKELIKHLQFGPGEIEKVTTQWQRFEDEFKGFEVR
jgi:acylphosphatase